MDAYQDGMDRPAAEVTWPSLDRREVDTERGYPSGMTPSLTTLHSLAWPAASSPPAGPAASESSPSLPGGK